MATKKTIIRKKKPTKKTTNKPKVRITTKKQISTKKTRI